MRRYLPLLMAALLASCGPAPYPTERGDARIALFKQCMQLAAAMPRQSDDDVSDVVNACSSQAWYMTNHIGEQTP
jgi:hypothetical protein